MCKNGQDSAGLFRIRNIRVLTNDFVVVVVVTYFSYFKNFLGYNLNEVYDDLIKFNFDENRWQIIQPTGNRPVSNHHILCNLIR